MKLPKISIIIPTYNRAYLVKETVKAVLNQSYENTEVIVVSDGGTDNTDKRLKLLDDDRLTFTMANRNSGLPSAVRNIGIKKSTGDFIAFCDDDDIWMQGKLTRQLKEFEKNKDLLGVATNMTFSPDRRINSYFLLQNRVISYSSLLQYGSPLGASTMLIRRNVLDEVGLFDESPIIKGFEDWDLWLRILKCRDKSIKLLKSSWVKYRIDNMKLTTSDNFEIEKESAALVHIYTKHLPASEQMLKKVSEKEVFNKLHSMSSSSRLLYYGVISPKDVLKKEQFSFKERCIILGKYYLKYIYYYFNKIYRRVEMIS